VAKNRHVFLYPQLQFTPFAQKTPLWTIIFHKGTVLWIKYEKALRLLDLFDIIFVFSLLTTDATNISCPQIVDKLWIGYPRL